jgi:hypothetical protein
MRPSAEREEEILHLEELRGAITQEIPDIGHGFSPEKLLCTASEM